MTQEQYEAYHVRQQQVHGEPVDFAVRDFTADDITAALAALGPDD